MRTLVCAGTKPLGLFMVVCGTAALVSLMQCEDGMMSIDSVGRPGLHLATAFHGVAHVTGSVLLNVWV